MSTTHLFVELLVIGVGAFLAVVLLGLAVFGYPASLAGDLEKVDLNIVLLTGLLPLLSFVYVLGILVDRLADLSFDSSDKKHRKAVFESDTEGYYVCRRTLVTDFPELWAQIDYGRSRLRICRGWIVNSGFLLAASVIFYLWREPAFIAMWQFIFVCVFFLVLGLASFLTWKKLNLSEYNKIKRQGAWALEQSGKSLMNHIEENTDDSEGGNASIEVHDRPG